MKNSTIAERPVLTRVQIIWFNTTARDNAKKDAFAKRATWETRTAFAFFPKIVLQQVLSVNRFYFLIHFKFEMIQCWHRGTNITTIIILIVTSATAARLQEAKRNILSVWHSLSTDVCQLWKAEKVFQIVCRWMFLQQELCQRSQQQMRSHQRLSAQR